MTDQARIAQLVENVRTASAAQQATAERLQNTEPGESRNQQIVSSIAQVRAAERELQQALPAGTTLSQALGVADPSTTPNRETGSQVSGGGVNQPSAQGGNRYLQNVLDGARLGNLQFNIQENILNSYDRYTYHFGLFMVGDQDYERVDIYKDIFSPNSVRKFTLAESGVTAGFNIVDVEIKDSVSPSFRTRNTITSEMTLTLTEPYGMTLVDKMFNASKELGIMNYRFAPLILTLEIRGYTENGVAIRTSPIKKAWKILIIDFESTLNESGSTYRITATSHNSMAFRDQYYMLPTNLVIYVNENGTPTAVAASAPATPTPPAAATRQETVIEYNAMGDVVGTRLVTVPAPASAPAQAATAPAPVQQSIPSGQSPQLTASPTVTPPTRINGSVGQFFTKLGEIMTQFYKNARQNPTTEGVRSRTAVATPFLIYEFQVAPELADQMLDMSPTTNNRRARFSPGSHLREIHVSRVGIGELVDDIMASLTNANWLIVDQESGRIKIPRVESRIEHVGWDGILNDYVKKITFYITIMETLRSVPDPDYGNHYQSSPQNQLTRLQRIADQGLNKLYPYIYSGYNTEIISFEIKFNNLHVIPMPLYGGLTITPSAEGQSAQRRLQTLRGELDNTDRSLVTGRERITALTGQIATVGEQLTNVARNAATPTLAPVTPYTTSSPSRRGRDTRAEQQRQADENAAAGARLAAQQEALRQQQTALQTELGTVNTQLQELERDKLRIETELSQQSIREIVIFDSATAGRLGLNYTPESEVIQRRAASQAQNQSRRQGRNFVEDLSIYQENPAQLSYIGDPRDLNNTSNRSPLTADPRNNPMRNIYSTILGQIYDRAGLQLTEVEMEIRGDPYWLGITNMERIYELDGYLRNGGPRTYASSTTDNRNRPFANYFGRDAQFLLLFRSGQQPSEQTGFMDFTRATTQNQSVFFNGVYNTIEVTHTFSNGKFTQKLLGVRDALVNLNNLPAASAGSTASSQGAASPASPASPAASQPSGINTTQPQAVDPVATARPGSEGTPPVGSPTPASQAAASSTANGPAGDAQRRADNAVILAQTRNEEFVGGTLGVAAQTSGGSIFGSNSGRSIYDPGGPPLTNEQIRSLGVSQAELDRVTQENLARRGSGR
jgi:hypothetical protein